MWWIAIVDNASRSLGAQRDVRFASEMPSKGIKKESFTWRRHCICFLEAVSTQERHPAEWRAVLERRAVPGSKGLGCLAFHFESF